MKTFAKVLILSLFTMVFVLSGCQSLEEKEKKMLKEIDEKQITPEEKQKEKLKARIEKNYQDAEAHYKLGRIYQKQGLWSQAEFEYNVTLSFEPTHREAQAGVVRALKEMGDENRAQMAADIYMNQVSGSAKESLLLAIAFQHQDLENLAIKCYRKALNLAPDSYKVNRQMGFYYLNKGDKAKAQQYLTRSFQINPNQPEVAEELGKMGVQVQIPKQKEKGSFLDKLFEKKEKEAQEQQNQ